MISPDGRYVIVFNGEIYNHTEVRSLVVRECSQAGVSVRWRGASDTETLLAALEHLGPERAINECSGMFAFAFYDKQSRELVLARDRFGEKPLYYYSEGGTFAFASEIKALRVAVERPLEIDRRAISAYYREGLPRSTQEAMAMARPIITTDWVGCRETVEDGINGFLVPIKNPQALAAAMERFILKPELIVQMGAESRRIAERRFDVRIINARILERMGLEEPKRDLKNQLSNRSKTAAN